MTAHLALFQSLPLAFLPSLLQELIEYDYKFPVERVELEKELAQLSALSPTEFQNVLVGFSRLRLSSAQEKVDWVNQPIYFTEQFSAYLWSTHQMDGFRDAATAYGLRMRATASAPAPPMQRLGIAVIGQGVDSYDLPLFAKLRPLGTYFSNVDPAGGLQKVMAITAARSQAYSAPYAHWYVDGGTAEASHSLLTRVSYAELAPLRKTLLERIQQETTKAGMGPEELRNYLARLTPADLGFLGDPILSRFQMKVLTEGSGTQIFSTTFAQWTTREILRRASATTLLARFAPRQRQRPMNELLSSKEDHSETDPVGSLIDADMAAYYHYINQQRLPGHQRAAFLAWFEGHNQAVCIAPSLPRGVESRSALNLTELLTLVTG